jgi:hypothetical protein
MLGRLARMEARYRSGVRFVAALKLWVLIRRKFPRLEAQFINERAVLLPPFFARGTTPKIFVPIGRLTRTCFLKLDHAAENNNCFRRDPLFS